MGSDTIGLTRNGQLSTVHGFRYKIFGDMAVIAYRRGVSQV